MPGRRAPRSNRPTPADRARRRQEAEEAARHIDPSDPFGSRSRADDDRTTQPAPAPWTEADVEARRGRPVPTAPASPETELLSRAVDILAELLALAKQADENAANPTDPHAPR